MQAQQGLGEEEEEEAEKIFFLILKLKSPKKKKNAVLVTLAGTFSFCSLCQSGKFHLLFRRVREEEQRLALYQVL